MTVPVLSPGAVTELLARSRAGSAEALNTLTPLLYAELRRIASGYMRRERVGQTLQATALVNEAYLRLLRDAQLSFANRAHFLGIAAQAMREILVERARARGAAKRGGHRARVTLDEGAASTPAPVADVLALDEALDRLQALDVQQARIVELRYFGGLTIEETAEALGVSPATVKRDWMVARAWLFRELAPADPSDT